jgi:hypothetical protein
MDVIEHETQIAHDFRGRPSACTGCDRLRGKLTAKERKAPCDGPRWAWTVSGLQESKGTMVWEFEESGVVVGMNYGEAITNLISWSDASLDCLDTDAEFTITICRIDVAMTGGT